jgi:hypothetical protein
MNKKKLGYIALMIFILVQPIMAYGLTLDSDLTYRDGDNLGAVYFTYDVTSPRITWTTTHIVFNDFRMNNVYSFGIIGYATNNNTSLNVTECSPTRTVLDITTPVGTTLQGSVYARDKGRPGDVDGVDTWNYDDVNKLVTFTQDANGTVTIYWTLRPEGYDARNIAAENLNFGSLMITAAALVGIVGLLTGTIEMNDTMGFIVMIMLAALILMVLTNLVLNTPTFI